MPRKALLILLAAALVTGATLTFFLLRRPKPAPPAAAAPAAATAPEVTIPASIRGKHLAPVAAPVPGTVDELLVNVGDQVYEGQLLGRIRNTGIESEKQAATEEAAAAEERLNRLEGEMAPMRLEHSRARAEYSRAQSEFERVDKQYQRELMLLREGAIPKLKFEKTEAEHKERREERDTLKEAADAAEQRVAELQRHIDTQRSVRDEKNRELEAAAEHAAAAELHSPADGILVSIAHKAGEEVAADLPNLLVIATNITDLEAVAEPEPPVLARIRPEQEVLLTVVEYPDAIPGRVRAVEGKQVIIEFQSPTPAVRPGLTAQVRFRF